MLRHVRVKILKSADNAFVEKMIGKRITSPLIEGLYSIAKSRNTTSISHVSMSKDLMSKFGLLKKKALSCMMHHNTKKIMKRAKILDNKFLM